jgi:hypothetical protein
MLGSRGFENRHPAAFTAIEEIKTAMPEAIEFQWVDGRIRSLLRSTAPRQAMGR